MRGSTMALRAITVRRSLRARPFQLPLGRIPPTWRHFATEPTVRETSIPEHPDPSTFHILSPSSSTAQASSSNSSSSSSSSSSSMAPDTKPASSSDPSPSSVSVINNLPAVPSVPPRRKSVAHPFDTYAFVTFLEKSKFTQPASIALMEAVRVLMVRRSDGATGETMSKEEQENAAYLFRAALTELRTEMDVRTRNQSTTLRGMIGAIRREVDALEQKMKEEMATMKHDIEIEVNNRKAETRSEQKGQYLDIEELNNKFTISLGDLRTDIEINKWVQTRRFIGAVFIVLSFGTFLFLSRRRNKEIKSRPAPPPPQKDVAVGTDDDVLDDFEDVTAERLEQILQDSGVNRLEIPAKNVKMAKGKTRSPERI